MWITLLFACSSPETAEPMPWTAPDAPGFWSPGTFEATAPGPGVELPVQVWYPASAEGSGPFMYGGVVSGAATIDAPMDDTRSYPVVMFSHGNGGTRFQSYFLAEALAAHGYIVVAPDHVGNTFDNNTADRVDIAVRRPKDIAAAFDWLIDASNDSASPLFGRIDADAGYAMVGHSFGGFTTLAVAGASVDVDGLAAVCAAGGDFLCGLEDVWAGSEADSRAWAAVPMAPVGRYTFGANLADIEVPITVLGGRIDELTTLTGEVTPIWDALTAEPRHFGIIDQAGHYSFTDFCFVLPNADGCRDTDLPLEQAHAVVSATTIAFLDVTRGESRSDAYLPPDSDVLDWQSAP